MGWKDGKPSMISYENTGDIHINKRYGDQFSIKEINWHQYKKLLGFCKIH